MIPRGAVKLTRIQGLATVLFLFGIATGGTAAGQAQCQSGPGCQSPSTPPKVVASSATAKATPKKVWTTDDLASDSKSADAQKQADDTKQQNSGLTATSDAGSDASDTSSDTSKPVPTLSGGSPIPATPEELEKKIETTQQEILQITSDLYNAKKAYFDEKDDDLRSKLKFTVSILEDELQENSNDLNLLQARLDELKKPQAAPASDKP